MGKHVKKKKYLLRILILSWVVRGRTLQTAGKGILRSNLTETLSYFYVEQWLDN